MTKWFIDLMLKDISPTISALELFWTILWTVILLRYIGRVHAGIIGISILNKAKENTVTRDAKQSIEPALVRVHTRAQRFLWIVIAAECMLLTGVTAMTQPPSAAAANDDPIAIVAPMLFIIMGLSVAAMGEIEERGDQHLRTLNAEYNALLLVENAQLRERVRLLETMLPIVGEHDALAEDQS